MNTISHRLLLMTIKNKKTQEELHGLDNYKFQVVCGATNVERKTTGGVGLGALAGGLMSGSASGAVAGAAYTKNVSEDQIEGQSLGKTAPMAGRSTVTRTTMLFNTDLNHQRRV